MNDLSPKQPGGVIKGPLGLTLETLNINEIKTAEKNANIHPDEQIELIGGSMNRFGAVHPPLVDENNRLIDGHGRLEAARRAGMETIEVIRAAHLTGNEKKALALALNQLPRMAHFDLGILKEQFEEIEADPELSLDTELLGFSDAEIDQIMLVGEDGPEEAEQEEPLPDIDRSENRYCSWLRGSFLTFPFWDGKRTLFYQSERVSNLPLADIW